MTRSWLFLAVLALALPATAAYQTAVVDGTISPSEYAYSSGNWSVTWDATYLYVAHASTAQFVFYVDVDPQTCSVAGTNANGNVTGVGDQLSGSTGTITPALPLRADARALTGSGGDSLNIRDGSGGWTTAGGSPIASAVGATAREISIRWDSIPGLTGVPSTFRFLGFEMTDDGSGNAQSSDPLPSVNPTGTATSPTLSYFYDVDFTLNPTSYDWTTRRHRLFYVTTSADSGTGSLRDIITQENADSADYRRHVAFNMGDGTTIQLLSNLPLMNNGGVYLDATTQPGFVSNPIVVLRGTSATDSATPSYGLQLGGGAVFVAYRGFIFQNCYYGIHSTDGFTALLDTCWFGVDSTGNAAAPNSYAIYAVDWDNSTVKNCIFSGNTVSGGTWPANAPVFINNTFGLGADGTTVIPSSAGMSCERCQLGTGVSGQGNRFGGIVGDAITVTSGFQTNVTLFGNTFGLAADGVTARAISGSALTGSDTDGMVGDRTNAARSNTFTNCAAGAITLVQNTNGKGLNVVNNSFYANASYGISVTGTATRQATPSIAAATVNGAGQLTITYSLAYNTGTTFNDPQQIVLEVYDADLTDTNVPQGKTRRAYLELGQSADIVNATWNAGGGFNVGDKIVMTASSHAGCCNDHGDGTSPFTPVVTTTFAADKVFTGPGSFSDTTKWNGGTLPTAGQSLQIIGSCSFDVTTQLAYSSLTLGDGSTAGNLSFTSGTADLLNVTDINALTAGSSINMNSGGGLSFSGTWNAANMTLAAGNSTVTFTGTGQTMPALTFHSVSITGSVTALSGTPVVQGGFFSVTGTFAPASGTIEFGPTVTVNGGGTIQFYNLTVDPSAEVAVSTSFSVVSQMVMNGILTPAASVVISGAGTMSGNGAIGVTAASLASQYTLATDISAFEVRFIGTSAQTIGAGTYGSLLITNNSGASLAGAVTTTNFYLQSGVVTTGANSLAVTGSAISTGGWINGRLTLTIATGTHTYAFPIGTSSFSMPVSATTTATSGGTVTFGATAGEHPQIASSGITSSKDVNGYWTITPGTAVFGPLNLTFTFGGNIDGSAAPTSFVLRAYASSAWSNVSATAGSTSISATGVTVSSATDFAAGNDVIDHYTITASSPQSANIAFLATVTAVDSLGFTVNDSTTVVTMNSSSPHVKYDSNNNGNFNDSTKTLSNGTFTISTKDNTGETMTLTATDGTHTGTSSSIVVIGPASATTSTISANPTSIAADGTSTSSITVQAKDSSGTNLVAGGDTVTLSTNRGTLGAVTDNHNGTYSATLTSSTSAGTATVSGTMNGTAMTHTASVTLTPGSATTLVLSAPSSTTLGSTISVTVTARDSHANTATGYTGTVHFTSSDGAATLPANYTFTAGDNGVHAFNVTFNSGGSQGVTATDTVTASITGSTSVTVSTPFGAPQNFAATAASTSQVSLSWTPVAGATSYEIFRSTGHSAYTSYATTSNTTYPDAGVVANTTYVYEVRAIGGSGTSAFSAIDPATTIVFTDPTLNSAVNIKTTHITELRTAVNAMRAAGGLGAATFTDSTLTSSTPIKAVHITELRDALDAARSAIGLPALSYTDPTITVGVTTLKAAHITELRAGTQ